LIEIKHDGFRIIARKSGGQVRLYSRPGNDFTRRFPLIADALARLRSRSCIIKSPERLSKKCRPLSKKCTLNPLQV
jgi:ATP-dependent DNA ligase